VERTEIEYEHLNFLHQVFYSLGIHITHVFGYFIIILNSLLRPYWVADHARLFFDNGSCENVWRSNRL
jgi:hypothetical protein